MKNRRFIDLFVAHSFALVKTSNCNLSPQELIREYMKVLNKNERKMYRDICDYKDRFKIGTDDETDEPQEISQWIDFMTKEIKRMCPNEGYENFSSENMEDYDEYISEEEI